MKDETGTTPTFPPRSGKGSGTKEWAAFAADHGIAVADDADRDTIIAAVDAVFGDPEPEQPAEAVTLTRGHARTFAMTPAGLTFTFDLGTGDTVRVWQFPPPKPKTVASLDESSADEVTSWRLRVLNGDGKAIASLRNPDRTYSTSEVNALIERLAASR